MIVNSVYIQVLFSYINRNILERYKMKFKYQGRKSSYLSFFRMNIKSYFDLKCRQNFLNICYQKIREQACKKFNLSNCTFILFVFYDILDAVEF